MEQISESLPLAALLTLSGGLMDACSYLGRGHVFANAQTGNILLLGVSLASGDMATALRYLIPVTCFALGIALSELIRRRMCAHPRVHWRQAVLLGEAMVLVLAAFLPQEANLAANSLISMACGAQVESFRKVAGNTAATTMCIGNLRAGVQALCDWLFGGRDRSALRRSLLYFAIILCFVAGAVIGDRLLRLWGDRALLACPLLLLIACLMMRLHSDSVGKEGTT